MVRMSTMMMMMMITLGGEGVGKGEGCEIWVVCKDSIGGRGFVRLDI